MSKPGGWGLVLLETPVRASFSGISRVRNPSHPVARLSKNQSSYSRTAYCEFATIWIVNARPICCV